MVTRTAKRIEVRLDEAHAERLERVLESKGQSVSEFVREAIDEAARDDNVMEMRKLLQSFRDDPLIVPPFEELKRLLDEERFSCEPASPGQES